MNEIKTWADTHIKGDPVIWGIVLMLAAISVFVVYSATGALAYRQMESVEYYLFKHSTLISMSLFAMWVAHKIDYRYYSNFLILDCWFLSRYYFMLGRQE